MRSMRVATELRAIDLRPSHQFEDEIAAASSENLVLINKTEFSIRTGSKGAAKTRRL